MQRKQGILVDASWHIAERNIEVDVEATIGHNGRHAPSLLFGIAPADQATIKNR